MGSSKRCCDNQSMISRPEFEHHTFLENDHMIVFQRIIYKQMCLNCKEDFGVTGLEGHVIVAWDDGSFIKAIATEWKNEGKLSELWSETPSTSECFN